MRFEDEWKSPAFIRGRIWEKVMSKLAVSIVCIMVGAGTLWAVQPASEQPAGQPGGQPAGQPQQRPERGPGGPGGPGGGRQASVDAGMKAMNRAARALNGQISDTTKKDENIRLINEMQRGCAMAKGLPVPEDFLKSAKDEAAKAKIIAEYRTDMIKVMRTMIDIEEAIIAGKVDQAKAGMEAVEKMREASHTRLGVKED